MLVDPCVLPSSAQFHPDPAVYQIVGRSRKPQEYVNGYDIIIAMQKWRLERGYFSTNQMEITMDLSLVLKS
jgi:hypothetical protein